MVSKKTKEILQRDEKVLRMIAKSVPKEDIIKPKIQKVLKEMTSALENQHDGVAIAAPQIGYSLRIFIVSGKIFTKDFLKDTEEHVKKIVSEKERKHLIFINPKITKLSKEKKWLPEGCLSVRWLYGKTYRSTKATVEAFDEHGNKFTRGGSGLLAQIFQHETDHLNGILFHDHAKELQEEHPG